MTRETTGAWRNEFQDQFSLGAVALGKRSGHACAARELPGSEDGDAKDASAEVRCQREVGE
ncbi:MAG: hypothetical protein DCC65_15675 [Planctomycetota bacterium]|nr:MAG: hypothetical protein DCC65_15675 [Planctomycetota bacterium]